MSEQVSDEKLRELSDVAAALGYVEGVLMTIEAYPRGFNVESVTEARKKLAQAIARLRREVTAGPIKFVAEFIDSVSYEYTEALQMIRAQGFVFKTDLTKANLTESERWEKLAFSLYSRLVEASTTANNAYEVLREAFPELLAKITQPPNAAEPQE